MITYTTVQSDQDLLGILKLQSKNLPQSLTPEEKAQEGFVTVNHDLATLQRMHAIEPSIIAKEGDSVIAYLLAMTSKSRSDVQILESMFEMFDETTYNGKTISGYHYVVVGQVCVDIKFRGTGVLDYMYDFYWHHFNTKYDFAITEINTTNIRSLKAHARIGFNTAYDYTNPGGTHWSVLIWDWKPVI